jgi:uncharacterized protein (DUF58 family)
VYNADVNRTGSVASLKSFVITVAFVFLFVVAVLLDLQYLYIMSVTIALLPLGSFLLAWQLASRYSSERTHLETIPEGRQATIRVAVMAQGGLPQAALKVSDPLPPMLVRAEPDAQEFEPLDAWDGAQGEKTYLVEPLLRGVYTIGATRLEMTDPLGLFSFSAEIGAPTQIVVHPVAIPARDWASGGAGAYGIRERDGRTRRGDGMDFHTVRDYQPGDPLRRVHWRTSARRGRLAVIEHERAYQQNLVIGLDLAKDTEFGSGRETTLEYAVKSAATLVDRTLAAGGGVHLITQNDHIEIQHREGDGGAARFRLFDILARAQATSDRSLADALLAARLPDGMEVAILTASGDPILTGHLVERIRRGDSVRVYFFEPSSFGGPSQPTPAVPKGELRIIERSDSPWEEGGKRLEYQLRDA